MYSLKECAVGGIPWKYFKGLGSNCFLFWSSLQETSSRWEAAKAALLEAVGAVGGGGGGAGGAGGAGGVGL